MFSFSRKYDLLHYERCLLLNFLILLLSAAIENVHCSLQAALNLQDSFAELSSNQLSSSQNAMNSPLTGQLLHHINQHHHQQQQQQQLNNQTGLDNPPGSFDQHQLDQHQLEQNHLLSGKSNAEQLPISQPMVMQNFQDQNGLWSMQLDKSAQNSNPSMDYGPTLLPSLSPAQFLNSQNMAGNLPLTGSFDYNSPLANSIHYNSSPSISSLSTFQSPRPFTANNRNENHSSNFNANSIYNDPNQNHHNHHSRSHHSSNTASITVQPSGGFKKISLPSDLGTLNHNLFGNMLPPLANLPSNSKLRINTADSADVLSFKKKNTFNARKSQMRSNLKESNPLPNFLLTNKRNIPANSWPQISTQLNSQLSSKLNLNSNEDTFPKVPDYATNKFIPDRMQNDDEYESDEESGLKNNANMNGNMNTPNDSGDDENFSNTFGSNNDLEPPGGPMTSDNSNKKKNLNSVDPMNLLLYNKFNQLNSADGKGKMLNSNQNNQPYYVILPQPIPANTPFEDILENGSFDANPPVHQQQKRRKSKDKPAQKLSWWHRLLPQSLRPQPPAPAASSHEQSSEENASDSSRYKDTKFKSSYLKAPESDLFTEVYGTGLQPNIPLPVFQPMNTAQLLQTLPYQQAAGFHTPGGGMLGLPGGSSSSLSSLYPTGAEGEPNEEEAAAEEDAEEEEGHSSSQNPTLADRMKNWWKNIFKSGEKSEKSQQQDHHSRKAASRLTPKILISNGII